MNTFGSVWLNTTLPGLDLTASANLITPTALQATLAAALPSGAGVIHRDIIRLRLTRSIVFEQTLRTNWLYWLNAHPD